MCVREPLGPYVPSDETRHDAGIPVVDCDGFAGSVVVVWNFDLQLPLEVSLNSTGASLPMEGQLRWGQQPRASRPP